ncbi:MAG: FecR domain-containing protein [Desulfobacterales bacterium]|nr:FecR domain-containing protein [Desulfobacterales bacterium]
MIVKIVIYYRFIKISLFVFLIIFLNSTNSNAADFNFESPTVTMLNGNASITKAGASEPGPLFLNDFLDSGDHIRTDNNTRLEITMPDGSYIRVAENSFFKISSIKEPDQFEDNSVSISLFTGNFWTTSSYFIVKECFSIKTKPFNTHNGITVFKVEITKDDFASVKVYQGGAEIQNLSPEQKLSKNNDAEKIHPANNAAFPGKWHYSINQMYQSIIRPDCTPTAPFRFTLKSDMSNWVDWNLSFDAAE